MERLLIIDGNNLLFQMFYGFPTKIYNKAQKTIHATIGFISYLLKEIKLYQISKAVVVFDGDANAIRLTLDENYKANRTNDWDLMPDDEVPFNEEKYIHRCLNFLDVKFLYSANMEADDLIASIALSFEGEVIISSFDSDFFQLINEKISVLRYRGKASVVYDLNYFINKYHFHPSKYVLYKALVGDTSDNIKGITGIGSKKATHLLQTCTSIDDLLVFSPDNYISERIINLINEGVDLLNKNMLLIKLNRMPGNDHANEEFSFNREKICLSNTEVLTQCNIFNE